MQTQAVLASLSLQAAQLLLRLAEVDLQGGQVACQGVNLNLKADASDSSTSGLTALTNLATFRISARDNVCQQCAAKKSQTAVPLCRMPITVLEQNLCDGRDAVLRIPAGKSSATGARSFLAELARTGCPFRPLPLR
eukprot:s4005_g3.t1